MTTLALQAQSGQRLRAIDDPTKHINWPVLLIISTFHVGALWAPFTFSWARLGWCLALHWLTCSVGICLGYHRLLTHRSLKVPRVVEHMLTFCGVIAGQGGPIGWVSTHRNHHYRSDEAGDPHTPREGFFWAHMAWCLHYSVPRSEYDYYKKFAKDLVRDPMHIFWNRTQGYWVVGTSLLVLFIWGWSMFVWAVCLRMVLSYHSTWLVNSAAHCWGYRLYETPEGSRNLWWVALASYGEGWHNTHNACQISARHGHRWWEFDATYLFIALLKRLRLASHIRLHPALVKPGTIAATATVAATSVPAS